MDYKPLEFKNEVEENLTKYIPERPYKDREYKPYLEGWSDLCGSCEHYYAHIHSKGLTQIEFPPECTRHILDPIKALKVDDFESTEEYQELLMIADPVTWAYSKFADDAGNGWRARWYQEEIMSCTALKKVVRAGRRCGKTEAICVIMLWMTQTNNDYSVLVICPFEAQVNLIWDKLEHFINQCPEVQRSIRRSTKSPEHRLEFNNGSKIIGFSSGAQSSARSDKVRGQDAHYIVLDEADYLAASDVEAILAILASHPNCGLWASSTPVGWHMKFYQWCVQKDLGFKEFHFVSQESPSWGEKAEHFFRTNYDAVTFDHEFLAEFGIQEAGVFRNDLIDKSIMDYQLPRPKTGPGTRVVIGVDWNGQDVGCHIVVVEAVQSTKGLKYLLLEKAIIKGAEFTQHASVAKIMELDEQYGADFIYVDHGYGEVQVEMLLMAGKNYPKSRLHKKTKAYAMGGRIEIRDPLTNQMIKKAAKPFLVNNCARSLEQGLLVLPQSEDTQVLVESVEGQETRQHAGIIQQMRNFSIERYSSTGLPTYSQGEDHTLTAFMLAITGFILEFSDMRKSQVVEAVLPIGQKNMDGTPVPKEDENKDLAALVRQLDAGQGASTRINNGNYSVVGIEARKDAVRRSISKGDKTAIRNYFGVGGRTTLSGPGRKSF